jgi:hypothetical protein
MAYFIGNNFRTDDIVSELFCNKNEVKAEIQMVFIGFDIDLMVVEDVSFVNENVCTSARR